MVVAAAAGGLAAPSGDRAPVLIPIAIAMGLAVLAIAVTRFELFVGSILLVRSSLDAVDLGSSTLDPAGAISVLFVGASVVWLLAHRYDAPPSPTATLLPPVAALFLCALASIAFSDHPLESLFEVVRFGTLVVIVAVLGRLIRDGRSMRFVLMATLGSLIVPLAVASSQMLSGGSGLLTASGLARIRGTFTHSNPFAAYLFLMITLIVSLYPHLERRWKVVLVPLALACGGALIATYARGAWAATVLALVVIGFLQDRRILWLLGGAMIAIAIAVPSVGVRLSDITETRKESGAPGNSLIWRFEYWQEVLALQDNPVLGIGFKEVELTQSVEKAPHNDPIRIFVETGILGFAAYVWVLVTLGLQARATLGRAPPGISRGLAVAFVASFAGLVLLSVAANVITQLVILWYFVTIVVLAMASSRFPDPETVRA